MSNQPARRWHVGSVSTRSIGRFGAPLVTRDAPRLSTDDHIRAKKTLITSGTDPLQNPIFAMVEDGALAEEYAALLVEVANAQEEDETAGT